MVKRFVALAIVSGYILTAVDSFARTRIYSAGGIGIAFPQAKKGDMLYRPFFAPHVSTMVSIPLSKKLSFETGSVYTIKGFNNRFFMDYGKEQVEFRGKTRFHYLSVPVLLSYNCFKTKNSKVWLGAGMNYGFFIWGLERSKVLVYDNYRLASSYSQTLPVKGAFSNSRYINSPNTKNVQIVDVMLRLQINCIWKDKFIMGVFHDHSLQDIDGKKLSDAYSIVKLRYTGLTFGYQWH